MNWHFRANFSKRMQYHKNAISVFIQLALACAPITAVKSRIWVLTSSGNRFGWNSPFLSWYFLRCLCIDW